MPETLAQTPVTDPDRLAALERQVAELRAQMDATADVMELAFEMGHAHGVRSVTGQGPAVPSLAASRARLRLVTAS